MDQRLETQDGIPESLSLLPADGVEDEQTTAVIYSHLRKIARSMMRTERRDHTLQPTALVHEAWVKLAAGQEQKYKDRDHFLNIAARAMRQILFDHARARVAQRRSPQADDRERLKENQTGGTPVVDLLALDEALNHLAKRDARLAKIVELRCFCDLSVEETAEVLQLSPTTVKREWRIARTLLLDTLDHGSKA